MGGEGAHVLEERGPLEPGGGPTVFTVGHGARPLQEFLAVLEEPGVRRLVDVRTAPGSRRHPHFGQAELATALAARGIDYVWERDLGGWRRARPDSPHVSIRSPGFRGYADHMETEEFDRAVRRVVGWAEDAPTAVMCAESMWWRCHRRLLADALAVRGCRVVHLLGPGRVEPHRLHPAARVEGTRIVYDLPVPDRPGAPALRPTRRKASAAAAKASRGSRTSPRGP
jgi:uncharacterized protein (DUF488 family)